MPYQSENSHRPDDNTQLNIPDFLLNPTVSRRVEDRPPTETHPRRASAELDADPADDTTDTIEETNVERHAEETVEASEDVTPEVDEDVAPEVDAEPVDVTAEADEENIEADSDAEIEGVAEAESEADAEPETDDAEVDAEDESEFADADDEAEVVEQDADVEYEPEAVESDEDVKDEATEVGDEAVESDDTSEDAPEETASPVVEPAASAISSHEAEIDAMMESVMRAASRPAAHQAADEQQVEEPAAESENHPADNPDATEETETTQLTQGQSTPSDLSLPRITLDTEHRPLSRRQNRSHGYTPAYRDITQGSPLPESDSPSATDSESTSPNTQEISAAQEQLAALQLRITQAQEALQELAAQQEKQPEPEQEPEPPVPTIEEDLATMERIERRLYAHRYASTELDAYGASIDPSKATADRSEALAVLAEEDHELLSAPGVGEAIERLCSHEDELEPIVAAQVKVLAKDRTRLVSVPADLNSELVRLTAESYDVWVRARKTDDWASFAPYLDRLVDIKRKVALARDPEAHPYDTLLDEFEPGTNRTFYNSFFARVKQSVVPLLSSISMSGQVMSRACVEGHFDERRQWDLAEDICAIMGIDERAHYLTSTVHPFSEAMTSNYAITASHIVGDNLMSNIYTMLHELGHNLYEQGVNPEFNRTSLKGGTSSGMHEAQSRFFENCVGRDRAFMVPLLGLMRNRFPGQLSRVTPNQLYRAVNQVDASLIRVEADEVSYPLHILVRYEIEKLLFEGKTTANEVPKLWGDLYERYIGVRPTTDTEGALQDVHWAVGEFGYFPSYALGNAYAAQLRAKMIEEGMDWNALLRAGDLEPIRAWLKDRIWQYGRSREPRQLIQDACGEPFSPRHYANYLTDKYVALYGLGRA